MNKNRFCSTLPSHDVMANCVRALKVSDNTSQFVCLETLCHMLLVYPGHFAFAVAPSATPLKYYSCSFLTSKVVAGHLCFGHCLPGSPAWLRGGAADLIAWPPEIFLQGGLCLPGVCDRSRGDACYNGVYLRSHSLTLASAWRAEQGDTFLSADVIASAPHRSCLHELWGQPEGLFQLKRHRSCHKITNKSLSSGSTGASGFRVWSTHGCIFTFYHLVTDISRFNFGSRHNTKPWQSDPVNPLVPAHF